MSSAIPSKHEMIMESETNALYKFLLETDEKPWYIPPETRRVLIRRGRFRCVLCGVTHRNRFDRFHIDHILPVARGGKALLENLQVLCVSCNLQKSSHLLSPESYAKGYVIPIYVESERKIQEEILEKIENELA
jgi:5-methylcytosine-specific restriction enzyme A